MKYSMFRTNKRKGGVYDLKKNKNIKQIHGKQILQGFLNSPKPLLTPGNKFARRQETMPGDTTHLVLTFLC